MKLCSRCKERPAVVFVTKVENDKTTNQGLCIKCARELNVKPVNDLIEKMGITDEQIDEMSEQMAGFFGDEDFDAELSEDELNGAPALDIKSFLSNGMPTPEEPAAGSGGDKKEGKKAPKDNKRKNLNAYCIDLTAKARKGQVDRIIGREKELSRVVQILNRRGKNNPCLIGEPGVGKTAIAEALAQRIVNGELPHKLLNKEVFMLDLTTLVAGTQFRGQFENRMRGLIDEVKSLGNIILVIDEIHTIVGAGDAEGGMSAANILKPALSRGEIQVIGATTLTEYRKYIEKDAALERRFQPVMVEEPSVDNAVTILRGVKDYYEKYHGITVPEGVVRQAVLLSERYITDRYLPDKAIDLLDEACSRLALDTPVINMIDTVSETLNKLVEQRTQIDSKLEKSEEDYEQLAEMKVQEINLEKQLETLREEQKNVRLTLEDLSKVIEIWTGIPASSIKEDEFVKIDTLDSRLKSRIVGQDQAINAICRAIKRRRAGISYKKKPVSFIFAGPTGVGKTELVKCLARELFDTPDALIRLDMSEFMEKYSVSKIIGSPPGYVGYDDAGQLTEKIRRKPYSVVLFDEIEKAHPDVLNILLQVLDDGRITDSHGKEVNFENTILVMTTNAGMNDLALSGFAGNLHDSDKEKTNRGLERFLRPEFINRIDEVITFNRLSRENFANIARLQLADLESVLKEKEILFSYTDEALDIIVEESYSEKYGARNLRRYIETHIEDDIAGAIVSAYEKPVVEVNVSASDGKLAVIASYEPA